MRASHRIVSIIAGAAFCVGLPGCDAIKTAKREIAEREQQIQESSANFARRTTPHVSFVSRPFLGTEVQPFTGGTPLPTRLELNPGGFRFSGSQGVPLESALLAIRSASGLSVVLDEAPGSPNVIAVGDLPYWSGPLSSFLDVLATEYDVAWNFDGKAVRIRPYLTRTYVLPTPTAKPSFQAGSSTAGSGSDTGTQQIAADLSDVDPWKDIEALLKLSVDGDATYATSPSTGELTVTARPSALSRIESLVDGLYERHGSQVLLRVSWMVVDISDSDNYQLDLQTLFTDAASGLRIGTVSPIGNLLDVAGSGGIAVVDAPDDSDLRNWDPSRLLYTAISKSGRLLDHRTYAQAVQNNTPTAFNDRTLRDYLKNFSRQVGTNGSGDTFSTETETLSLGSSVQVLPRILSADRVSLLLTVSQASLVDLQTIALGDDGSFIQLAERAERGIPAETVILENGQSLVLAGFEGDTVSRDQIGTGTPGFFGLGGAQQAEIKRTRLILVVTATIKRPPPRRRPAPVILTQRAGS